MTAYADYTYYSGTYLGTAIAEANFDALALRASAVVDRLTYQRAADVTDEDELALIKNAVCAIAEEMQTIANEGSSGGIQSESIGSNSVTYAANNVRMKTDYQRYEEAARLYLEDTGLMFKGFAAGEYSGETEVDE